MKLSGHFRVLVGVLTGLALLAVVVLAIQRSGQPAPMMLAAAHDGEIVCNGDCATCPHEKSSLCSAQASDESQAATAHVDADRCIGCARCVNISPQAFRMNPETRKAEVIDGATAEDIACGMQACPVGAVSR